MLNTLLLTKLFLIPNLILLLYQETTLDRAPSERFITNILWVEPLKKLSGVQCLGIPYNMVNVRLASDRRRLTWSLSAAAYAQKGILMILTRLSHEICWNLWLLQHKLVVWAWLSPVWLDLSLWVQLQAMWFTAFQEVIIHIYIQINVRHQTSWSHHRNSQVDGRVLYSRYHGRTRSALLVER